METTTKFFHDKHLRTKTIVQFWTVVILSFGFYLIYYVKVKQTSLHLHKMIKQKLSNLYNLCLSFGYEAKSEDQTMLIDVCMDLNNFDYNRVLGQVSDYYASHNQTSHHDSSNLDSLVKRMQVVIRQFNSLVNHFNMSLFHFPVSYLAYQLAWEPYQMIKCPWNQGA